MSEPQRTTPAIPQALQDALAADAAAARIFDAERPEQRRAHIRWVEGRSFNLTGQIKRAAQVIATLHAHEHSRLREGIKPRSKKEPGT